MLGTLGRVRSSASGCRSPGHASLAWLQPQLLLAAPVPIHVSTAASTWGGHLFQCIAYAFMIVATPFPALTCCDNGGRHAGHPRMRSTWILCIDNLLFEKVGPETIALND